MRRIRQVRATQQRGRAAGRSQDGVLKQPLNRGRREPCPVHRLAATPWKAQGEPGLPQEKREAGEHPPPALQPRPKGDP